MAEEKGYTVVGLYTDNKQVWVGHIKAKSVRSALGKARVAMIRGGGGGTVLTIFEGEHRDVYGGDELYEE